MEIKTKFGQKHVFEFQQPEEEVWGLHGFLRLSSKQMFLRFPLLFKDLAPGLELGVSTVQVNQRRKELPLGDLSLRLQEMTEDINLKLETALQRTEDGMVKSTAEGKSR